MVVLVILAIIGILAIFAGLYYLCSTKFPKVGNKIDEGVEKVVSKFKKNKDSETVSELDKLDK